MPGFSESKFASTQPAEPAPATMMSYVSFMTASSEGHLTAAGHGRSKCATKIIGAVVASVARDLRRLRPGSQVVSRYHHPKFEADRCAGRCRSISTVREFIELYSENDCHDLALMASIRCCPITKQNAAGSHNGIKFETVLPRRALNEGRCNLGADRCGRTATNADNANPAGPASSQKLREGKVLVREQTE